VLRGLLAHREVKDGVLYRDGLVLRDPPVPVFFFKGRRGL
jgi:hypothetical protein